MVRASLPQSGVELQVEVPFGWPGNKQQLQLVAAQRVPAMASATADDGALLETLREAVTKGGAVKRSLRDFMDAASAALGRVA